MNYFVVKSCVLLCLLLISLYEDLKMRRIPNTVTISGMISGIIINLTGQGFLGLLFSLKGIFIAFLLLSIPFMIGGLGGGDVKLVMAVGAIMGTDFVLKSIVYVVAVGALIATIIILARREIYRFKKIKEYLFSTFLLKDLVPINSDGEALFFPYGIAIATGVAIQYLVAFGHIIKL